MAPTLKLVVRLGMCFVALAHTALGVPTATSSLITSSALSTAHSNITRRVLDVDLSHCWHSPGSELAIPNVCHCYGRHTGPSSYRKSLIDAIRSACTALAAHPMGSEWVTQFDFAFYYSPDATVQTEYRSAVTLIKLIFVGNGNVSPCQTPIALSYDQCWHALHAPLDQCDTGGENDKYGGWAYDACFEWTLDPNPYTNNPGVKLPDVGQWNAGLALWEDCHVVGGCAV